MMVQEADLVEDFVVDEETYWCVYYSKFLLYMEKK